MSNKNQLREKLLIDVIAFVACLIGYYSLIPLITNPPIENADSQKTIYTSIIIIILIFTILLNHDLIPFFDKFDKKFNKLQKHPPESNTANLERIPPTRSSYLFLVLILILLILFLGLVIVTDSFRSFFNILLLNTSMLELYSYFKIISLFF